MSANEIEQEYSFTYTDCDGKVTETKIQTPGITWMDCLNDYVRFLEQVYGYPIMHKVRIEEPKYRQRMVENYADYNEPWKGQFFTADEDLDQYEE